MSGLRTKAYRFKESIKRKREQKRYGKCAVLLYHRVATPSSDPQLLSVKPENFDAQLELLKRAYNVLSVSEFESLIGSDKKFPDRSVLVTFDDGYADNYLHAMPLLEKNKLQALFYISTSTIDTSREFWWDEVERLVLLPGSFPEEFDLTIAGVHFLSTKHKPIQHEFFYESTLPLLRNLSFSEREKALDKIRTLSSAKTPRESHRPMTLAELKKFAASNSVVIGAHTKNHASLAALSPDEQFTEINESKIFLERELNRKMDHFSYPFGTRSDFNEATEIICRDLQFKWVAANYPDVVTAKTSPISFPRFIVRDWSQQQFKKELERFFKA